MKKGIYKPTKQNIIIIDELEEYCEVLLDGEYKTLLKSEIQISSSNINVSTLNELKENIFINCIKNPLSDILYSYNTNRLTPEPHQYKPLVKFLNSENNRVLIADEVGLGKTIEAGMIYKEIDKREELKISLIVVPSSLTYKWQEELNIRFDEYFTIYKTNQFLNFIDEVENYSSSKLINEKIIISYHTLRDERVIKKLNNSFFEVDFLIKYDNSLIPIEVKSAINVDSNSASSLKKFLNEFNEKAKFGLIIYKGKELKKISHNIYAVPFWFIFS